MHLFQSKIPEKYLCNVYGSSSNSPTRHYIFSKQFQKRNKKATKANYAINN